ELRGSDELRGAQSLRVGPAARGGGPRGPRGDPRRPAVNPPVLVDHASGGRVMKGRIAVLKAYGGEFELREYPVPDPEAGAILIRLTRAGICGSDLHIWRGEMKEVYGAIPQDLTFGHEMCGRVARLGAGVTTDSLGAPLSEGDRVTFCYFFPCG